MKTETVRGLSPVDVNLLELAIGAGIPLRYFEFGLQNNALLRQNIPEPRFREWFLSILDRGLLTWSDSRQGRDHFKHRRYVVSDRGWLALADYLCAVDQNDYHYYKTFDGSSSALTKLQKTDTKIQFKGRKDSISLKQLLRDMPKHVRQRWLDANPGWKSQLG